LERFRQSEGVAEKPNQPGRDPELDRLALEIGQRIRARRERLGLTEAELGKAVGRSKRAVQELSTGNATRQYAKLARLSKALQTTPSDLLGFESAEILSGRTAQAILEEALYFVAEQALHLPADQASYGVLLKALAQVVAQDVIAALQRHEEGSGSNPGFDKLGNRIEETFRALFGGRMQ
jgi:HTH-type transcriptional regulator/antitoxin HipB